MNHTFATYGISELLVKKSTFYLKCTKNVNRIVHLEHIEQCLPKVSLKMNLFSGFQT